MTSLPDSPVEFVTQYVLNSIFESMVAHYHKRGLNLIKHEVYNKTPGPSYKQSPGTRSIMAYLIDPDDGQRVALVHYYLLKDGATIGASGKMDPKRVFWNGIDYRVRIGRKGS